MKRPKEGSIFEVDLGEGLGSVIGVIARTAPTGLLVYVFPSTGQHDKLDASEAIYVGRIGTQGFADGSWQLLGPLPGFNRQVWPVPRFRRVVRGTGREEMPFIITYDDQLDEVEMRGASKEEVAGLPPDRLSGAGAALVHFRKALRQARQTQQHRPAA